jgi:hypothetical protein
MVQIHRPDHFIPLSYRLTPKLLVITRTPEGQKREQCRLRENREKFRKRRARHDCCRFRDEPQLQPAGPARTAELKGGAIPVSM